ncbi:hypothetical protein AW115_11605 [Escherichia coli]|nr:hypothetical protein AW066_26585 [Escherichia coli]OTE53428.1 hypothetical protein AW115_11605 [Escherichia coli]TJQ03860.1 hypothetical protein C9Z71_24780 [Escherichia coli]
MKLVFVPLKDVFKECKGKRQFSIKKDAYRRFSSVSNEMQIGIKKIAALYWALPARHKRLSNRLSTPPVRLTFFVTSQVALRPTML